MAKDPNFRKYETVFILRTDVSQEEAAKLQEKVDGIIGEHGGHMIRREDWGPRKLAYKIEKQTKGHYQYMLFLGKGGLVKEIERNFRLADAVLKFMTVVVDESVALDSVNFEEEAKEQTWMAQNKGKKLTGDAERSTAAAPAPASNETQEEAPAPAEEVKEEA